MNRFSGIQYKGTLHSYQQRILGNMEKYLEDGKVNIVAAPGSGKLVLGLEMIRRLGEPCLILSPAPAIREQWGQCFKDLFLEDESRFEELFSTDLHHVKLVNSITYQAISGAMDRIPPTEEGEVDSSDIALFKTIKKYNIKTVCLDEAHHLKEEWQNALEKFLDRLDKDVKRISLMAALPCDAEQTEWNRYYSVCGEIDDGILEPELVAQGALCPYQDYIYFNYPSQEEVCFFEEYKGHKAIAKEEEEKPEGNHAVPGELGKAFVSSVGKLKSIEDITLHEYRTLGKDLRMLIHTDDICVEKDLSKIGSEEAFQDMNAVSIFETLRRLDDTMNVGIFSDNLLILPLSVVPQGTMVITEPLAGTRYVKVEVFGTTHEVAALVGGLFREGKLQVLVGRESSLGEEGNESCINSLILTGSEDSFGAFNQVRGKVIRTDPDAPDKTANIWHLATLEAQSMGKENFREHLVAAGEEYGDGVRSYGFEVVKRRFDYFMGPNYETGEIESGIRRVTLFRPSFDANSMLQINRKMLEMSKDRRAMSEMWKGQLAGDGLRVVMETLLPLNNSVPPFRYVVSRSIRDNRDVLLGVLVLLICYIGFGVILLMEVLHFLQFGYIITCIFCMLVPGFAIKEFIFSSAWKRIKCLLQYRTPAHSLKAIGKMMAKTLSVCKIIAPGAYVELENKPFSGQRRGIRLRNASLHDQHIFSKAMQEMLAPIHNPRYLIICKENNYYLAQYSLACPSVIEQKKQYVRVLEKYLKENLGFMEVVYIWNHEGQELLELCHNVSIANQNAERKKDIPLLESDTKYIVVREGEENG